MAINEAWVLDGVALTSGNFDVLELNVDPPKARSDWVSASDSDAAVLMRQPLHENRVITTKIRVLPQASMDAALDQIGVIRDKLRKASAISTGIALVWTPARSTRSVTFDVLAGEIPEMPIGIEGQAISWFKQRPIFTIELTCKPYWRGAEVTVTTAAAGSPFVTQELGPIPGDIAALGRLVITDTATQNRRHVEWGLEAPETYNSSASLLIDSDSMVTSGFAGTQTTKTNAYDPNASGNSAITASIPSWATPLAGTGLQSHVGQFRVKARIWGSLSEKARLVWRVGDGSYSTNPWVTMIINGDWCEVDLGLIQIPPVALGTQRWDGRVELISDNTAGPQSVWLDFLMLIPTDAGYGKARAMLALQDGIAYAFDNFTSTTAGNAINGRTANLGGTWAGSGDATDFVFADGPNTGDETASRTATGDVSTERGRISRVGSTAPSDTDIRVSVRGSTTSGSTQYEMGVVARYVSAGNFFTASLRWNPSNSHWELLVQLVIATAVTNLNIVHVPLSLVNAWWTIRALVFQSGRYYVELRDTTNGALLAAVDGLDSRLATGGTLATGTFGMRDYNPVAGAVTRYYDNFYTSAPPVEPVSIYSGRAMQIGHDDTIRQDSGGTYYGRPPAYRGSRFLVHPGTSRVMVKARRNDIEAVQDGSVTDATQIQVFYTPRGLVVPR